MSDETVVAPEAAAPVAAEAPAPVAAEPAPAPAPAGTKNTKEVLDLVLTIGNCLVEAEKDGKLGLEDAGLLLKILPKIGPAVADIGQVPAELKDLDMAEAEEIVAYVAAGLLVESDKAKAIVAASLKVAIGLFELIKAIKS